MFNGRDMTELTMKSMNDWNVDELKFYHHAFQQIAPYLNSEGVTIHRDIIREIEKRGGLQ